MTDEEPLISREPTAADPTAEHPLVTLEEGDAFELVEGRDDEPGPGESPASGNVQTAPDAATHRMSPRRAFSIIAAVLLVLLVALVIWLLYLLGRSGGLLERGGAEKASIEPVLMILGPGTGPQPYFDRPMGAAFGLRGRIYVADTGNDRVCVFDADGTFLFEFGGLGVKKPLPGGRYTWAPGRLNYPIGIAVDDADGSVFVADFRNDQVQKYDAEGRYITSFPPIDRPVGRGSSGQDGTGIAVTDVTVGGGRVYATDAYQICVFETDGRFIRQFGKPGFGPSDLDHPNGVAVGQDGTVYVSDSNHSRVIAFDALGRREWAFGEVPAGSQDASAGLGMPRGIAVMRDGWIVVADAFMFDLALIDPSGTTAQRVGERGVDPGQFNFANDVDVSGDLLLVADKENNRAAVLKLARR